MTGEPRNRSRRAALGSVAAALALPLAQACATPPPRARATPPVTWREAFGPRFTVVLDPGHGGNDPGAVGSNGLLEKDLTLDVARRLRERLVTFDDVDVALTRERDVWLSRADRVRAIRAAGADLLLSLHFNDLPQRDIALVETYYAHASDIIDSRARRRDDFARRPGVLALDLHEPDDVSFTRGSERFATLLQRHVFAAVERGHRRAVDAGTKRDALFVLTRSFVSGALVEMTCLSNDEEAERLTGDTYREQLAAALATAVHDFRGLSNVSAPVRTDI